MSNDASLESTVPLGELGSPEGNERAADGGGMPAIDIEEAKRRAAGTPFETLGGKVQRVPTFSSTPDTARSKASMGSRTSRSTCV